MAASITEQYRYFPSKEQLALDIFLGHHRALAEALAEAHQPVAGLRGEDRRHRPLLLRMGEQGLVLFALSPAHPASLFLAMVPDSTPNPVDVEYAASSLKRWSPARFPRAIPTSPPPRP